MMEMCGMIDDPECPKSGKTLRFWGNSNKEKLLGYKENHGRYMTLEKSVEDSRQWNIILHCIWGSCYRRNRKIHSLGWWAWKDSKEKIHTETLEK